MQTAGPKAQRSLAHFVQVWLAWLLPVSAVVLASAFCFYGAVEVGLCGCLIFAGAVTVLLKLLVAKTLLAYPQLPSKLWALLRYRVLQFSLRSLLLLTLAISVILSGLVVWRAQVERQKERVAAISEHGGFVDYDCYLTDKAVPPVPEWLWRRVGIDYFGRVSGVCFDAAPGPSLAVRDLKLQQLPHLRWVSFNLTGIGDSDLLEIAELAELRELGLQQTAVTDQGLRHPISLRKLESLWLYRTQVTDAGLEHLEKITSLRELELWRTSVSDAGLKHLEGLTELRRLNLSDTEVTDAGLLHVGRLKKLETLSLIGTRVSDAAVPQLSGLSRLKHLYLDRTNVTPAGVSALKRALPECEITK